MMNEKKPTWICAVCDKNISFEELYLDAYMEEVRSVVIHAFMSSPRIASLCEDSRSFFHTRRRIDGGPF